MNKIDKKIDNIEINTILKIVPHYSIKVFLKLFFLAIVIECFDVTETIVDWTAYPPRTPNHEQLSKNNPRTYSFL